MGTFDAEQLLAQLRSEGAFDSEGRFSIDAGRAASLLGRFLLDDPARRILLVVACAVASDAPRLDVDLERAGWRAAFEGRPIGAGDLQMLLPACLSGVAHEMPARIRDLATVVATAHGDGAVVTVESCDFRVVIAEGQTSASRAADPTTRLRVERDARYVRRDLETLLRKAALLAPLEVRLNGRKLPQGLDLRTAIACRIVSDPSGGRACEVPLQGPPRAQRVEMSVAAPQPPRLQVPPIAPVAQPLEVPPVAPVAQPLEVPPVAPVAQPLEVPPVAPVAQSLQVPPVAPVAQSLQVPPVAPVAQSLQVPPVAPVAQSQIATGFGAVLWIASTSPAPSRLTVVIHGVPYEHAIDLAVAGVQIVAAIPWAATDLSRAALVDDDALRAALAALADQAVRLLLQAEDAPPEWRMRQLLALSRHAVAPRFELEIAVAVASCALRLYEAEDARLMRAVDRVSELAGRDSPPSRRLRTALVARWREAGRAAFPEPLYHASRFYERVVEEQRRLEEPRHFQDDLLRFGIICAMRHDARATSLLEEARALQGERGEASLEAAACLEVMEERFEAGLGRLAACAERWRALGTPAAAERCALARSQIAEALLADPNGAPGGFLDAMADVLPGGAFLRDVERSLTDPASRTPQRLAMALAYDALVTLWGAVPPPRPSS